jgi:hypothetical protein
MEKELLLPDRKMKRKKTKVAITAALADMKMRVRGGGTNSKG